MKINGPQIFAARSIKWTITEREKKIENDQDEKNKTKKTQQHTHKDDKIVVRINLNYWACFMKI